jgi:hypothetical protein
VSIGKYGEDENHAAGGKKAGKEGGRSQSGQKRGGGRRDEEIKKTKEVGNGVYVYWRNGGGRAVKEREGR